MIFLHDDVYKCLKYKKKKAFFIKMTICIIHKNVPIVFKLENCSGIYVNSLSTEFKE